MLRKFLALSQLLYEIHTMQLLSECQYVVIELFANKTFHHFNVTGNLSYGVPSISFHSHSYLYL